MTWPALSLAEAHARLTAPGAPFETVEATITGVRMRVWKHAPATAAQAFAAAGKPRPFMEAVMSGLSVGVPGNIRLAAKAHDRSGRFAELCEPYDGFHGMVFSEESTVAPFALRARREGLRDFGAVMSPHNAFAILQGVETLGLRMERHVANTRKVVEFLVAHPAVESVAYPELASHPDHALAQRLLPKGCGAVFSFAIRGDRAAGRRFVDALKVFSHLANVGDAKSLVIHPASTTHFRVPVEQLAAAGITEGTMRLSIGLEDADDLIEDLGRGLRAAQKGA